jgi:ribosome maturation protein Sdo1
LGSVSSSVSQKKIFEISANQSILLALAAILNIRLERKTLGHRLTLTPMGKCSNAFSETTNMINAKLYMNVHWMVLYNLKIVCSDMKLKMAATAGQRFFSETTWTIETKPCTVWR